MIWRQHALRAPSHVEIFTLSTLPHLLQIYNGGTLCNRKKGATNGVYI